MINIQVLKEVVSLALTRVPIPSLMKTHSHNCLSNLGSMSGLLRQGCYLGCEVHHMTTLLPCKEGGTRLHWHHISIFTDPVCIHPTTDHMEKVFLKSTTMHNRLPVIMGQTTIWAVSAEPTEQVLIRVAQSWRRCLRLCLHMPMLPN